MLRWGKNVNCCTLTKKVIRVTCEIEKSLTIIRGSVGNGTAGPPDTLFLLHGPPGHNSGYRKVRGPRFNRRKKETRRTLFRHSTQKHITAQQS